PGGLAVLAVLPRRREGLAVLPVVAGGRDRLPAVLPRWWHRRLPVLAVLPVLPVLIGCGHTERLGRRLWLAWFLAHRSLRTLSGHRATDGCRPGAVVHDMTRGSPDSAPWVR